MYFYGYEISSVALFSVFSMFFVKINLNIHGMLKQKRAVMLKMTTPGLLSHHK